MKYVLPAAVLVVLTVVVFGLGLVELPFAGASESRSGQNHIPAYTISEMRALTERGERIDQEVVSAREFSSHLDEIENNLWAGKVGAFEAVDQARERSGELNPVYVRAARSRFPELSERDAVLAVMLNGMRTQLRLEGASPARPTAMLENIFCELSADPELSPELKQALSAIQRTEHVPATE